MYYNRLCTELCVSYTSTVLLVFLLFSISELSYFYCPVLLALFNQYSIISIVFIVSCCMIVDALLLLMWHWETFISRSYGIE